MLIRFSTKKLIICTLCELSLVAEFEALHGLILISRFLSTTGPISSASSTASTVLKLTKPNPLHNVVVVSLIKRTLSIGPHDSNNFQMSSSSAAVK